MNNLLHHKTKQFFFVLIKLSIVIGAFYFITQKLTSNAQMSLSVFSNFLVENKVLSTTNLVVLVLLTTLNWSLEILKWQQLILVFKKITFKDALEQSLGSLTASLVTPNRIGEYGAKAFYFVAKERKKVVMLNFIGNMLQMLVTCIFGLIGLVIFIYTHAINVAYFKISLLLLSIFFMLFFANRFFKKGTLNIKGVSIEKVIHFIKNIPKTIYVKTFGLSAIRYMVFSFQFYILLVFFKVEIGYIEAMMYISSMYLLASVIPSIFIFDVLIKGSVAIYLFSFTAINELIIISITTLMWLFNFVLPSVFGSYYVLNFNLPKTTEDQ